MRESFVPNDDGEYRDKHKQFKDELPGFATKYGVLPADVTQAATDDADLLAAFSVKQAADVAARQANDAYLAVKKTVTTNWRAEAKEIKARKNYVVADGVAMAIEGADVNPDWAAKQPTLKIEVVAGGVNVGFIKAGADGVNVYSRRKGEASFEFYRLALRSPLLDDRLNAVPGTPEEREYQGAFVVGGEEVGLRSDIATVVVPG